MAMTTETTGMIARRPELIQLCFVVGSLDEGMRAFSERVGAGPWFVVEHTGGSPHSTYRGATSPLHARIALGYSGDMMYELVEPTSEIESVFSEHVARHGYGLHHLGFGTTTFDAELCARGITAADVVFSDQTPRGARVAMVDGPAGSGVFEELIELTPGGLAFYAQMRAAAQEWDGRELVQL